MAVKPKAKVEKKTEEKVSVVRGEGTLHARYEADRITPYESDPLTSFLNEKLEAYPNLRVRPEGLTEFPAHCYGVLKATREVDGVKMEAVLNFNQRGYSMIDAIHLALAGIQYAGAYGFKILAKAPGRAPSKKAGGKKAPPGKTAKAPPTQDTNAAQGEKVVEVMSVNSMTFEPRAEGKCKVSFFKTGDQWPSIYITATYQSLEELLAPVGAFQAVHFESADSYDISANIYWTKGRLNTRGNPYKDIQRVESTVE